MIDMCLEVKIDMNNDPLGLLRKASPGTPASKQKKGADTTDYPSEFVVRVTTALTAGSHYGKVSVVRRIDKRVLFPFDGAPVIGPFSEGIDAREAAHAIARKVVTDDIANPEA